MSLFWTVYNSFNFKYWKNALRIPKDYAIWGFICEIPADRVITYMRYNHLTAPHFYERDLI